MVAGKKLVYESIPLDPVRALMGTVIQLNAAKDATGGGVDDDEVHMLSHDFIEGCLLAAPHPDLEDIGQAHL